MSCDEISDVLVKVFPDACQSHLCGQIKMVLIKMY